MTTSAQLRNRELGQIHQVAKQLGLEDEAYRMMLVTVTGKRSAADLDWRERARVIEHLKAKGGSAKPKARPAIPKDRAPFVSKIRAQLINHPAGRKPDSYADGISKQMFGVDNYTWCQPAQLEKIIQALAVDAKRKA